MEISYNEHGIIIDGVLRPSANPRLDFAKELSKTEDNSRMYVIEGENVKIGFNCIIGDNGFGFVRDGDTLFPMPHRGNVILEDDVEIRNNVCIDRAVLGSTIIGKGTKIDNLCHIAHNVKIGKNNTIAAKCSIEGSVVIGDNNTFGSGVIVQRKVRVGSNCIFGSGAVVVKDVEDNSVMVGNPAKLLRKI